MVVQPLRSLQRSDLQVFLDNPAKLLQQSEDLQLAVASSVDAPRQLLEVLASSSVARVADAARLHVNYAGEIGDNWEQAAEEILRSRQMGQNDRLAVELLKLGAIPPCFLSQWVLADKLIAALRNPQMPLRYRLQLLERLAREDSLEPRLQVAESSETPLAVLEQLAGDLELAVRLAVKLNPSCPRELIELVEGQHAVASNWHADAAELAQLGQSRWAWIRLAVAQNPQTPETMLKLLAEDRVYKIRLAVAKNPSNTPAILALLAKSEDTKIRVAIAEHGNLTEEIMHELFRTQQSLLKTRKALPSSILERFVRERVDCKPLWKDHRLRYFLLTQPNSPTWILDELTKIDLESLKAEKLAQELQGCSTPGTHKKWVEDDLKFLVDVVKHPQVSLDILEKLVNYPNLAIALAVAENSQVSEARRLEIFEDLISSNERNIIQKIASNPKVPVSLLEKIAEWESPLNQFIIRLRKVLSRKMKEDNRESRADCYMDKIHKFLAEYQIGIEVEEWMTLIGSYQWMTLLEAPNYIGNLNGRYMRNAEFRGMINEQWRELFPNIPWSELKKVVNNIVCIPDALVGAIERDRAILVALVGNPNTPIALRAQLQNKLTKPLCKYSGYLRDTDMRMALAYNSAIPESQRIEYLQQLLANSGEVTREQIARNSATPLEIITQIMSCPKSARQAVSRNPNAPVTALAELALDSNISTREWVAKNPATPVEILVQLARLAIQKEDSRRVSMESRVREAAFKNPKFPTLERYRLLLETEKAKEAAQVHQLMARRSYSPYALGQVMEKGDRNTKISAARS